MTESNREKDHQADHEATPAAATSEVRSGNEMTLRVLTASTILTARDLPADEPLIVLCGRDRFAPHLLRDYAARCSETGRIAEAARARAEASRLEAWQADHARNRA